MTYRKLAAALFASSMIVPAAQAAPVVWNLDNVTFADGGTASGYFTFDAVTNGYSNWSISVVGGSTAGLPAFTYDTANGFVGVNTSSAVDFVNFPPNRYLRLSFASALTGAGGTTALIPTASFECGNCSPSRAIVTGSVTTAAVGSVPEPATWAMMLLGFGALGYAMRRRPGITTRIRFA